MIRNVSRRLQRLEDRAMATARGPIVFRILLVHPEEGLTGVLLIESDKPTIRVPPTSEEVERVRADLARLSQIPSVFLTQRAACLVATHFRY